MTKREPYQGSDAWHAERRTGYGASDAPVLVEGDEERWRQLHGEKLGLLPPREPNETMHLGKILEAVILKEGAAREGWKVRRVHRVLRHPELPFVFASLDARKAGDNRPVEVKKTGFKSDAWGAPGSDMVPTSILYQLQQQAAVTGADAVEVLTLFGGAKLERFTVGRDDTIIRELLALEVAAWEYVQRGEMPPWPGQAAKRIVIGQDEIEVDEIIADAVLGYEVHKNASEEAKALFDAERDVVRELLADAAGAKGVLPDGRTVTIAHRQNADSTVVAWDLVAKAYRRAVEDWRDMDGPNPGALDFDAIESMFTTTKPGARPLRITIGKGTT